MASIVLAVLPSMALALPDARDASWGTNGMFRLDAPSGVAWDFAVIDDGSVVATIGCDGVGTRGVFRLDARGALDATFGIGGFAECPAGAKSYNARIAVTDDGRILLASGTSGAAVIVRYTQAGLIDRPFGVEGIARVPAFVGEQLPYALAVDRHGRIVASIGYLCGEAYPCAPAIVRWHSDGTLDRSFGDEGIVRPQVQGVVTGFAFHADDRISVAINDFRMIQVARLLNDGTMDVRFGSEGLVSVPPWATTTRTSSVVVQGDGKVVVGGSLKLPWLPSGEGSTAVFLARFDDQGRLDRTFGSGGVLIPDTFGDADRASIAIQPDGKLLLAAVEDVSPPTSPGSLFVARFNPDGSPDLQFGGAGFAPLPTGYSQFDVQVKVRPDGRIVVGDALGARNGRPYWQATRYPVFYQVEGGTTPLPRFWREAQAVEYFHTGFGHYFVTALAQEIEDLDVHAPNGWVRTGRKFHVWTEGGSGAVPVCRFFSDQSFAPKSSHFYTPYAEECAELKRGTVWKHEGDTFHLQLPTGGPGMGTCPFGSRPLYRAYNNGLSGAPNHRYTIEVSLLDAMIALGWTMEGEAQTRTFACVPLQQ